MITAVIGNPIGSPVVGKAVGTIATTVKQYMDAYDDHFVPNFPSQKLWKYANKRPVRRADVQRLLTQIYTAEREKGWPLFGVDQLVLTGHDRTARQAELSDTTIETEIGSLPHVNLLFEGLSVDQRNDLELAMQIRTDLDLRFAPGGRTSETVAFASEICSGLNHAGFGAVTELLLQANAYRPNDVMPKQAILDPTSDKYVELFQRAYFARYNEITTGVRTTITYVKTGGDSGGASKSTTANGSRPGAYEGMKLGWIWDRNMDSNTIVRTMGDVQRVIQDMVDTMPRMERDEQSKKWGRVGRLFFTNNPLTQQKIIVTLPKRTTPNQAYPQGKQAALGEAGYSEAADSTDGDMIAIGWGVLEAMMSGIARHAWGDPLYPSRFMPQSFLDGFFGGIPRIINLPHISEDLMQALAQAAQAAALGYEPILVMSEGEYTKLREWFSQQENLVAKRRWAEGNSIGQIGFSLLYQLLNFWGPLSVYERSPQVNRARYYVLGVLGVINVFVTPLLMMTGFIAFAGILLIFWSIVIIANQVITLNGLAAAIHERGFWAGASVWLSERLRDVILFGPLVFLESIGELSGMTKEEYLEFVFRISGGASTRYTINYWQDVLEGDIPDTIDKHTFSQAAHIYRWTFMVGFVGTIWNVTAIWVLGLLNVGMLYPTLLFTLGVMISPYVFQSFKGPTERFRTFKRAWPVLAGFLFGVLIIALIALGGSELELQRLLPLALQPLLPRMAWFPNATFLFAATALLSLLIPGRVILVKIGKFYSNPPAVKHDVIKREQTKHNKYVLLFWAFIALGTLVGVSLRTNPIVGLFVASPFLYKWIDMLVRRPWAEGSDAAILRNPTYWKAISSPFRHRNDRRAHLVRLGPGARVVFGARDRL